VYQYQFQRSKNGGFLFDYHDPGSTTNEDNVEIFPKQSICFMGGMVEIKAIALVAIGDAFGL